MISKLLLMENIEARRVYRMDVLRSQVYMQTISSNSLCIVTQETYNEMHCMHAYCNSKLYK